ncbi:SH3 domain-containing protein [Nitrincola tapanii]|uniref:Glycine zipper 2TM domain-containing protein n=1 Tax=Nitrincola tapanii TaxID=1708751 RepID=A0A5A9W844_9GAMM|nr:SH3 domain-containing protein [Nitrincola tapanii]KAA0875641.1 glycine zipper 2TM domain-containing protein [Nitrincola tapanii]
MKPKALAVALLSASFTLAGCNATQQNTLFSKENLGTVIGAGAGILIGSQVGGGDGRRLAMLAGAIAGGMIGKHIGASLDERDRRALEMQTQAALMSGQDGQTIYWQSEHSGATAQITPVATETRTQAASMQRTTRVQSVPNLTLLNAPYETTAGVNIRSAPSTTSDRIGSLAAGTSFTALGRTDNDWIAVGRRGVNVGYIYAPLVRPVVAQQATGTDLDTLVVSRNNADQSGFDLDNLTVTTDQVQAATQCRTLQYDIQAAGSAESTQVKACQAADGAWELI